MSQQATEIIGWLGAVIAAICFLPQVIRVFKLKSTKDLSLWMTIIIIIGNGVWITYGVAINSPQVWGTNVCQLVFMIAILSFKIYNISTKKEEFTWKWPWTKKTKTKKED